MKAGVRFFLALLRISSRNRQAFFWTLLFPVVFMLASGFFGGDQQPIRVAVVAEAPVGVSTEGVAGADDETAGGTQAGNAPGASVGAGTAAGPAAKQLLNVFATTPTFDLHTDIDRATAMTQVEEGELDAVVLLPADLDQRLAAWTGEEPIPVEMLYHNGNYIQAQVIQGTVAGILRESGYALLGVTSPLAVESRPLGAPRLSYLDFVVPGLIAVTIMNASLFAMAMNLTSWREKGILKRLRATALSPGALLAGMVGNQLIVGVLSVAVLLLLATLAFHAKLELPLLRLGSLVVLGLVTFLALGFLVAGFVRKTEAVAPVLNIVTLPMMFLSGVFFPIESLPGWLQGLVSIFPLTFLVDGLRAVLNQGVPWAELGTEFLGLLLWIGATVLVAVRTFRWDQA